MPLKKVRIGSKAKAIYPIHYIYIKDTKDFLHKLDEVKHQIPDSAILVTFDIYA